MTDLCMMLFVGVKKTLMARQRGLRLFDDWCPFDPGTDSVGLNVLRLPLSEPTAMITHAAPS